MCASPMDCATPAGTALAGTDARPSRAAPAGTAPAGTDARSSLRELAELALFLNCAGACKVEISNYDHGGVHFTAVFQLVSQLTRPLAGAAISVLTARQRRTGVAAMPLRFLDRGAATPPQGELGSQGAATPPQGERGCICSWATGKRQRQDALQREAHDGPPRVRGCGTHNTASNQGTLSSSSGDAAGADP